MSASPEIVVVGSLNVDIVVPVPHLPAPGETVAGKDHFKTLGGKGANQAVAAARLGRSVAMVGRLGTDPDGDACLGGLEKDGVDVTHVVRDDTVPTGVALIAVDPQGENSIVVGPGSNAHLTSDDVARAGGYLEAAAVVLVQLEIPMRTVTAVAEAAAGRLILNPAPAPADPIPQEVLDRVWILTPNAVELAMLSGRAVESDDDVIAAARSLRGPQAIAVTLGGRGVILVTESEAISVPAPAEVDVVDSTAAGDAFCGALADALARGEQLADAIEWAVSAASVSVTKMGAQPSLPTAEEVTNRVSS